MRFTRKSSVHVLAGMVVGAGAITAVACGGDDSTDTSTTDGGASSSSGSTTSSSGSTTSSSGSTTSSSGSTGDAGGDAAKDGGDAGLLALGQGPCDAGTQCQSTVCYVPSNKPANSFCTIKCTMTNQNDPKCNDPALTGKCNGEGYCQKK